MGHEYVELKNPAAAIDSYRHAVGACSLKALSPYSFACIFFTYYVKPL